MGRPAYSSAGGQTHGMLGFVRVAVGTLLALVVPAWLGFAVIGYKQPAVGASDLVSPSVQVYDETGSFETVDARSLSDALRDIGFLRPVHLVVLSTDNLIDANIDEATLRYARTSHPEWIASNGYKWADGYLILSVSPSYRKVGTYFGEDIALPVSEQQDIQEAAKEDFRAKRWSRGIVAAARQAAALIPNEAGERLESGSRWPTWYAWLMSLGGFVILIRGWVLRGRTRANIRKIVEGWYALERQRADIDQIFWSLTNSGYYIRGLNARYDCARVEREQLRATLPSQMSVGFCASLSAQTLNATREVLATIEKLARADVAIVAARDLFTLAPTWREVWANEVGPVFEDLAAVESVARTVGARRCPPSVCAVIAHLDQWTNEQRDGLGLLGVSIERGQIGPVQAVEELDRIADEARARAADLVMAALAADTSYGGRMRYNRWENSEGGALTDSDVLYVGSYHTRGGVYSYDPSSTIRLTANCAGVHLSGYAADKSGRFEGYNARIYAQPRYLNRYVIYEETHSTSSSTSSANYGSQSGGFSGSGSSSSF